MSVATCPRCDEQVTVPGNAPAEAIVQCPLCQEEFELGEVLDKLPPTLAIIKMPKGHVEPASVRSDSDEFRFAPDDDDNDEGFRLASDPSDDAGDAPSFAFDASDSGDFSAGASAAGGAASSGARPAPRRKKKQKNPAVEIAKVAGGGVAGVTIAIVLLWYLPGRYAQDILGIGPTIGGIPVLGSIVPAKFRDGTTPPVNDATISEPIFVPPKGADDDNNSGRRGIEAFAPPEEEPLENLDVDLTNGLGDDTPANGDPLAVNFDDIETPDDTPNGNAAGPRAPGGQPLGPKNRRNVTPADLQAAVEAVNVSKKVYADSAGLPGPDRREPAANHYRDFGLLAQAITFIDQSDPAISANVRDTGDILADLAEDDNKISIMQYFAAQQLADTESADDGVLVIGTVTDVGALSRGLFRSSLTFIPAGGTADNPIEVTIVSPENPVDAGNGFEVGSRVAVLGTLVRDPSTNMRGYKGNEPVVIWGGYYVKLKES